MTNTISPEAIAHARLILNVDEPSIGRAPESDQGRLDVGAYLQHYGIPYREKNNGAGTIFLLDHCLFDQSHVKNESSIIQTGDGKLLYQCFHDGCKGREWKEARAKISGNDSLKTFCSFPTNENRDIDKLKPIEEKEILSHLERWDYIQGLDIQVDWLVDRLIPKGAITLIFGKGGIGKTWLALDMARAIGTGTPFLGLQTIRGQVIYIDFENPLAVLNARTQKLGDGQGVLFWRANNEKQKAPKLDSKEWDLYKRLPKMAVLIIDTLRASHGRDENASNEIGLIMGRLKELRDMGFTIILLHHTTKNSDKVAKGSTAIVDLSDHILGLTLVRKKKDGQEIIVDDEDFDEETVYRFGFREKTRFEPYQVYLTLNPDRGFELAPDPQEDTLKDMNKILTAKGKLAKVAFCEACRSLGLSKAKINKLLDIGAGRFWAITHDKWNKNSKTFTPCQFPSFPTLYSTEKLENTPFSFPEHKKNIEENFKEHNENIKFSSLPNEVWKTGKQEEQGDIFKLDEFEVVE